MSSTDSHIITQKNRKVKKNKKNLFIEGDFFKNFSIIVISQENTKQNKRKEMI